MTVKGSYWGNFYIPIEYNQNELQYYDVINHELAHALLTESTNHGLAFFEFSSLSSENLKKRDLMEVMKVLQDSSERVEECFAVLIPLMASCESEKQFIEKFNLLRKTEYYYRYYIEDFKRILFSNVPLKQREILVHNILDASMNTGVFTVDCDWLSKKSVYQTFVENPLLLVPDKRLKQILKWVNNNINNKDVFSFPDTKLHEEALGIPMPSNEQFTVFRNSIITMANSNSLSHKYTEERQTIQYYDDAPDTYSVDRVYFHIDDSEYKAFLVDIPNQVLLDCDTVLYFPLERKEHLVFTSNTRKEKYKLVMPAGSLSNELLDKFSGIIVAYLDDMESLESKLTSRKDKKIIYKSVCNFVQLEKLLHELNIKINKAGILQFDELIGSPFFQDNEGIIYCGGPRPLSVLLYYSRYPLTFVESKTFILETCITSYDFQVISSSDIAINDDKNKSIAVFNGNLDDKTFSDDVGIDAKEICGYYLGVFEETLKLNKWKDAQNLFNFMLNLLGNNEDKKLALLQIENIMLKCKRIMIENIKRTPELLQAFVELYSMVIKAHELLKTPTEDICITLTNLSNLYVEFLDFKHAYEYAHLVLNLRIKLWGPDSPKLARSYYLLGTTLLYNDRVQSKEIFNKAKKLAMESNDERLLSAIEMIMQIID